MFRTAVALPATGRVIPLNRPWLYLDFMGWNYPWVFSGFHGLTDAAGNATAVLNIPPYMPILGDEFDAVFVTHDLASPDGLGVISQPQHFVVVEGSNSGWTPLVPDADTVKIYVSSSTGNDANSGLSPADPVQTLAAGIALLRDGHPDWLLLKRGDTWTNQDFGGWTKSGASASAPMVISTYGSGPRPYIKTGSNHGLRAWGTVNHMVIEGVHLHAHTYSGTGRADGIEWNVSASTNVLIENCVIEGFSNGIDSTTGVKSDFRIRRNHILNTYATDGHSQGIYAQQIDGLLIEENFFDHCGWNDNVPGGQATIFNHAVYIQYDCTNVIVRGNIFVRPSATGVQVRPGGIVEDNLFVRCPIAFTFGSDYGTTTSLAGGVSGVIQRNVVLEGNDITSSLPRGIGGVIQHVSPTGLIIQDNIIAHDVSGQPYGYALQFQGGVGVGINNVTVKKNIVYDWRGGLRIHGTSGTQISGFNVQDNILQAPNGDNGLVYHLSPVGPGVTYTGNTYFSIPAPSAYWSPPNWAFKNGLQNNMDFQSWVASSGETGSIVQAINFADPYRSVLSFNVLLGGQSSLDDFAQNILAQDKGSFGTFTARTVNGYIRNGFEVLP